MGNQEELFSFGIEVLVYESRFSDLLRLSKGSFLGELTGISKRSLNEATWFEPWVCTTRVVALKKTLYPLGAPASSSVQWSRKCPQTLNGNAEHSALPIVGTQ